MDSKFSKEYFLQKARQKTKSDNISINNTSSAATLCSTHHIQPSPDPTVSSQQSTTITSPSPSISRTTAQHSSAMRPSSQQALDSAAGPPATTQEQPSTPHAVLPSDAQIPDSLPSHGHHGASFHPADQQPYQSAPPTQDLSSPPTASPTPCQSIDASLQTSHSHVPPSQATSQPDQDLTNSGQSVEPPSSPSPTLSQPSPPAKSTLSVPSNPTDSGSLQSQLFSHLSSILPSYNPNSASSLPRHYSDILTLLETEIIRSSIAVQESPSNTSTSSTTPIATSANGAQLRPTHPPSLELSTMLTSSELFKLYTQSIQQTKSLLFAKIQNQQQLNYLLLQVEASILDQHVSGLNTSSPSVKSFSLPTFSHYQQLLETELSDINSITVSTYQHYLEDLLRYHTQTVSQLSTTQQQQQQQQQQQLQTSNLSASSTPIPSPHSSSLSSSNSKLTQRSNEELSILLSSLQEGFETHLTSIHNELKYTELQKSQRLQEKYEALLQDAQRQAQQQSTFNPASSTPSYSHGHGHGHAHGAQFEYEEMAILKESQKQMIMALTLEIEQLKSQQNQNTAHNAPRLSSSSTNQENSITASESADTVPKQRYFEQVQNFNILQDELFYERQKNAQLQRQLELMIESQQQQQQQQQYQQQLPESHTQYEAIQPSHPSQTNQSPPSPLSYQPQTPPNAQNQTPAHLDPSNPNPNPNQSQSPQHAEQSRQQRSALSFW